jgi:hypothetical protein
MKVGSDENHIVYCESLSNLMEKSFIPTVAQLASDTALNQAMVFKVHMQHLGDKEVQFLDFNNLALMEVLLNGFQTK